MRVLVSMQNGFSCILVLCHHRWMHCWRQVCMHCRLAEGLDPGQAMQEVRNLQLQPGNLDRCYETCKMLMHQLLTVRDAALPHRS